MLILSIEALSKNYRIDTLLMYLLSMVNIENPSIISELIFELDMLSFGLLTIVLISSFTISLTHSTANALNALSLFNAFWTLNKFGNLIKE